MESPCFLLGPVWVKFQGTLGFKTIKRNKEQQRKETVGGGVALGMGREGEGEKLLNIRMKIKTQG
jgi:hypothetical protein